MGLVKLDDKSGVRDFLDAARAGRFWEREVQHDPSVRAVKPDVVRRGKKSPAAQ